MSSLALPPIHTKTPPIQPAGGSGQPTRTRKRSTPPLDDESDEEEEDDKRRGNGPSKKGKASGAWGWEDMGDYKYMVEIRQMMFVFGEVQTPLPETVKLVEDIVRGQIIEIVTRARLLTHLRSSRFLSPEDLIFLIRDDRGKVNRLRTYLSWKDVRKKAKEEAESAGQELELDVDEDKAMKKGKQMIKLPWELLTPFQTFLRSMPGKEDEDDEDDDELQAHEDSMQRLKEADEITKKMNKNEYAQYSECRQASFTYRRGRRFRDFINFSAYLDVRPNDDIVDILGFLAFEMVRSLCVTALDLRERLEKTRPPPSPVTAAVPKAPSPTKEPNAKTNNLTSLFAPPPSARQPLQPCHILEAFAQIQRAQAANRVGGMGNFKSGVGRKRMALV